MSDWIIYHQASLSGEKLVYFTTNKIPKQQKLKEYPRATCQRMRIV